MGGIWIEKNNKSLNLCSLTLILSCHCVLRFYNPFSTIFKSYYFFLFILFFSSFLIFFCIFFSFFILFVNAAAIPIIFYTIIYSPNKFQEFRYIMFAIVNLSKFLTFSIMRMRTIPLYTSYKNSPKCLPSFFSLFIYRNACACHLNSILW